jgi:hypothetical protein
MRIYKKCFSIYFLCIISVLASCKNENRIQSNSREKQLVENKIEAPAKQKYTEKEFSFEKVESDSIEQSKVIVQDKVKEKEIKVSSKEEVKRNPRKESKSAPIPKKKKSKPVIKKTKVMPKGKLSFNAEEYDFGFIEVGEVVDHTFKFVNTGKKPVNVSNAVASCGCTTPSFPFLPIEPGETGQIQVRFNSKDRLGSQIATVTVYSDAENNIQELKIKGVIRSEIVSPAEFIDTIK